MDAPNTHDDFYRRLRARVKDWASRKDLGDGKWMEYVLAAPDLFYLLVRLSLDGRVPFQQKVQLGLVVAYFISPIDLIPDFVPVAGMLDDIALAAYVLNGMLTDVDPAVVREHWAGEGDILQLIQRILSTADEMLGSGLWKRLKRLTGKGGGSGRGKGK